MIAYTTRAAPQVYNVKMLCKDRTIVSGMKKMLEQLNPVDIAPFSVRPHPQFQHLFSISPRSEQSFSRFTHIKVYQKTSRPHWKLFKDANYRVWRTNLYRILYRKCDVCSALFSPFAVISYAWLGRIHFVETYSKQLFPSSQSLLNLARVFILLTLTFFRFRQHYTVCLKSVQQDQKNYSMIDC